MNSAIDAARDGVVCEEWKSADGNATTNTPRSRIAAIHPPTNATERRIPDGIPNRTYTANTDVGLENATASPSSATETISVCMTQGRSRGGAGYILPGVDRGMSAAARSVKVAIWSMHTVTARLGASSLPGAISMPYVSLIRNPHGSS